MHDADGFDANDFKEWDGTAAGVVSAMRAAEETGTKHYNMIVSGLKEDGAHDESNWFGSLCMGVMQAKCSQLFVRQAMKHMPLKAKAAVLAGKNVVPALYGAVAFVLGMLAYRIML